jgi:hypothetical protein
MLGNHGSLEEYITKKRSLINTIEGIKEGGKLSVKTKIAALFAGLPPGSV